MQGDKASIKRVISIVCLLKQNPSWIISPERAVIAQDFRRIFDFLFIISPMSNWIKFLIALAVGIALGITYGWVIDPVQYTDAPPNILREDYRTDYVLMTAEIYKGEQDAESAVRRLAILGSESPAQITASALQYATSNGYAEDDVSLLRDLLNAMQTYQPQGDSAP